MSITLTGRLAWSEQVANLVCQASALPASLFPSRTAASAEANRNTLLAAFSTAQSYTELELRDATGLTFGTTAYCLRQLLASGLVFKDIDARPFRYYLNRA